MKKGPDHSFTLKQRLQISLAYGLGRLLIGLIGRTLRFEVDGWDHYARFHDRGRPVILSFWHSQIPAATYFWRNRGIVVMTSEHFDGEYIARIIESFGYGTSRGSSTRGGVRALLQLKKRLEEGRDVAFTIDGPKGPRQQVKAGPLLLSRKSGRPVVCFHIEPARYWQLRSWDRMRIPKPFSKVLVKIGPPFQVPPGDSHQDWMESYQQEMERLQHDCEKRTSRNT
ncbi:MAG TPA: lysophospholipid acyltransferase family protein [Acidobacteriota bacterium]|nr:lysophospholipid acyltransferase family protein [Acidobacteriota bacterium]